MDQVQSSSEEKSKCLYRQAAGNHCSVLTGAFEASRYPQKGNREGNAVYVATTEDRPSETIPMFVWYLLHCVDVIVPSSSRNRGFNSSLR